MPHDDARFLAGGNVFEKPGLAWRSRQRLENAARIDQFLIHALFSAAFWMGESRLMSACFSRLHILERAAQRQMLHARLAGNPGGIAGHERERMRGMLLFSAK